MPIADVSVSPNGIDSKWLLCEMVGPCVVGMAADGNRTIQREKLSTAVLYKCITSTNIYMEVVVVGMLYAVTALPPHFYPPAPPYEFHPMCNVP